MERVNNVENTPRKSAYTDDKIEWCIGKIMQLERQLEKLKPRLPKPWYTDISIWISILLVLIVLILVYIFYLTEMGWTVLLPEWMK